MNTFAVAACASTTRIRRVIFSPRETEQSQKVRWQVSVIRTWKQYDKLVNTQGCETEWEERHHGTRMCGTDCQVCERIEYCEACNELIYALEVFEREQLTNARAQSKLQESRQQVSQDFQSCGADCHHCGLPAICPRCNPLLTWSEPDANGDITAGCYTIERSDGTLGLPSMDRRALIGRTVLVDGVIMQTAKSACERHARKMLGWED